MIGNPFIIFFVGTIPLGLAFGALNKYKTDISIASAVKNDTDKILAMYQIHYTINIEYGKEIHGTQEVFTDLKLKGRR